MQIYSLFDAPMRSFSRGPAASADLHIGFHSRLLPPSLPRMTPREMPREMPHVSPPCAGPGGTCDYVFLQAGQSQRAFVATRGEWWACLRGGIRVAAPGHDAVMIGCADLFAPMPDMPMQVKVALDSILVRVVPDDSSASGGAMSFEDILLQGELSCHALGRVATLRDDDDDDDDGGEPGLVCSGTRPTPRMRAGFTQLPAGECLPVSGLRWALCHHGALCVRWSVGRETFLNFVQPGTLFVPDPHESYNLEALLPATGLLICGGAAQAEVPDSGDAARLLPDARPGVVEMMRAPYGRSVECLPA